ncbi:peroxin 26 protein [Rutstroemia sp. NJR-2017a WRK4]|nr:peroxin 26 protein [Rutstroemia sp. NJR-2017a WRK4]
MASNGSITAINTSDQLSPSHLLSNSISSLSSSRSSSRHTSQISKTYRQASTLFLTRRLPESLSTVLPVITPPSDTDTESANDPANSLAPVAKASRTTRIKVWSLYLTILNAILELDPAEGKQAFGTSQFRALVAKVRDGEVWEEVVKNGYQGIEGDVDADVVINLSTLLLAHSRSQKVNQTRLETYLATSSTPSLSASISTTPTTANPFPSKRRSAPGTETPRDLNTRVKILELYTLHVLLRNNEWEYAREFISMNEVLDEERREAFLGAWKSLKEESEESERRERAEKEYREEQLKREIEESRRRREEEERKGREELDRKARASGGNTGGTASSEVDYGIEDEAMVRNPATASVTSSTAPSSAAAKRTNTKKPKPPQRQKSVIEKAGTVISNLKRAILESGLGLRGNPLLVLRLLAFVVGIVAVFGRRQVRERMRRVVGEGWGRVRRTVGMGVKVSYI